MNDNRKLIIELLPICSPDLITNEMLSNAGGSSFLYFNSTSWNFNSPSVGH